MEFNFEGPRPEERVAIVQETLDRAYAKAMGILSDPIDPKDFQDIYGSVDADIALVEKKEKKFAEQAKMDSLEARNRRKIAAIFEAVIFEQIEQSNWFGETAVTIQTSRYDDIVNGVDTIVEFDEEENSSHLALALDVTTAISFSEKFKRIKEGIEREELAKIKYFRSDALNFRGEKSKIPHVVIGADRGTVFDVIGAWMRGDKKSLAAHPVQIKIIEEVRIQLEAFRRYAKSIGREDIVRIYGKTLRIIDKIVSEKGITEEDAAKAAEKDTFFQAIRDNAEEVAEGRTPSGYIAWDE